MEVGLRVVRGPDWKWGNQESGEGHVGTVVEIGKPGSSTSPDKSVVVQWDSGYRNNYRVGYEEAYDLRVLDNAPIGVKHQNIICFACEKQGIQGMRWKCTKCHDFDLCTACYMADKHDLGHAFLRIENALSRGENMPTRKDTQNSTRVQSFGIFAGAKVIRGPDWDWGNQDSKGGEGEIGKTTVIGGWDSETGRSAAHVTWQSGLTNVYRVGHKGKVDLKYIQSAPGWTYYKEHLPVLGEFTDVSGQGGIPCQVKVGDKVHVDLEADILKCIQEGHGGWNPRMAEYIGKVGTVHRITERGDVRVQYEGCSNRWTFHPGALTKVHVFAVNDCVRISDNIHQVKEMQKSHGEWTENMKTTLGRVGRVLKVYADGDLRVAVANQTWTFNPACCSIVPSIEPDNNNTNGGHEQRDHSTTLSDLLEQLMDIRADTTGPERLVREAAQGHADAVKDIVTKHPDKVDQKSSGKSALQVASHQGHKEIVQILLTHNAKLTVQDEDGDTALHYSAFGNQPEVMELLLKKGAQINALNNGGCSTLHVAVNKQHAECVRILLKNKCNVNIQDSYGDTALHDAIGKEKQDIIDGLINYPSIDFTLKNKRGFNVLHHAALKGNNFATEKILQKCRQIVDIKKDDGFSAIHLAALNGHRDVTFSLLTLGQANIEIRNNRQQTPLLLAVSQGHTSIVELLVSSGADLRVEDEDGDTTLHLALMRQSVTSEQENTPMLDSIREHLEKKGLEDITWGILMTCYLAEKGADLYHKNHQGKTPLSIIGDSKTEEVVQEYATGNVTNIPSSEKECIICEDQQASIKFEPCGHVVVCQECCQRVKKIKRCFTCRANIEFKKIGDKELSEPIDNPSTDEDITVCTICMERKKDTAFLCGHMVCHVCGESLRNCHMCRRVITKKIPIYL